MLLTEALNRYLVFHELQGHSHKTIEAYNTFINKFIKFTGNIETLTITEEILSGYVLSLYRQQPELSRATIRTELVHLKAFLKWLHQNKYILSELHNVIHPPKAPKKTVKIYQPHEIDEIFNNITAESPWIVTRNKLIVALMIDSGLRQSEVATAKFNDIDFTWATLKVAGKGNKERFVPLGELTQELLMCYIKECPYDIWDHLFLDRFGNVITNNTIKMFIYKLQKKLSFKISSHKLRHNFATNYVINQYEERGIADMMQLQYIMGHEELVTTQKYLHLAYQIMSCKYNISHLDKLYKKSSNHTG